MNLEKITQQITALTRNVGEWILNESGNLQEKDIEVKGKHNYVTYVDKTSEEMIVTGLKKIIPDASILAEEGTSEACDSELTWIIDPLDGTTNFIHQIPLYSISVGLLRKERLISGVVHEINRKESFHAFYGGLDLAYVACGRFDGFYEYSLNPWDVSAGALIVEEAGGIVTDFKGGIDYLYGRQIVASNGKIHHAMLEIINKYFN